MKLNKVKVAGIDKVSFKDKETQKETIMYKYYIIVEKANVSGLVYDYCYSKSLIKDEYLPVIKLEGKYKIIELE